MREQGSRTSTQFTRLTVKSFFIEFKFHGSTGLGGREFTRDAFFGLNEYFANCFSNRFVVLLSLRIVRTFGLCHLVPHLKKKEQQAF